MIQYSIVRVLRRFDLNVEGDHSENTMTIDRYWIEGDSAEGERN